MTMTGTKKRFYEAAGVQSQDGLHAVVLDGRPVRTPAGKPLAVPSRALAQAVADEWQAQDAVIKPHTMPLTQLVNTALDRFETHREAVIDQTAGYADTDLLCYWAEEPRTLVERQRAVWQPLLDWLQRMHGIELQVTRGVLPCRQSDAAKAAIRQIVASTSNLELAGLASLTAAGGSVILALAVREGVLDAAAAFDVAQLEETFELQKWGEDFEATARRRVLRVDIEAACRLLELCRASRLH